MSISSSLRFSGNQFSSDTSDKNKTVNHQKYLLTTSLAFESIPDINYAGLINLI